MKKSKTENSKTSRFSALQFKNGKVLGNRVVVPPMASGTADSSGFVTAETIAHYTQLAKSGAGLVMVEYTSVHPSGRSESNQLGIETDEQISGLSKIAEVIHQSGAIAGIQITHAGGKTSRDMTGGVLMGPSSIAVPVKDRGMENPDAMTFEEIELWKEWFAAAFARAEKAGFDLVEIHAAHGYGLNQWISPITNQRTDAYGGSLQNNTRLLFEIVQNAKSIHPDLLLAIRMPGQDFLEGGLQLKDTQWIAMELEKLGLDLLDISSGIGGWRRPRDRSGEGYLVSEAAEIQSKVSLPVIGVGGIESGSFIDHALTKNQFSLAAVGRAILEKPLEWGQRNLCH